MVRNSLFASKVKSILNKAHTLSTGIRGQVVSRIILKQGYRIPRGWGVSHYLTDRDAAMIFPIPLNWVVGLSRRFWFVLMKGPDPAGFEKAIWDAEAKGYARAYIEIRRELEGSKLMWDRMFAEVLKERGIN